MRLLFTTIFFSLYLFSFAQEGTSLMINVSSDTILMENAFRIQYVVKNGSIEGFKNQDLQNFDLLQGPSRSSSMSIINGARSSEESITYYYRPTKVGKFHIDGFELTINGNIIKSNAAEIIVVANPDLLHQDPNSGQIEGQLRKPKNTNKRKRYRI